MTPSLSVLITYHNEGALLTRCLAAVAAQTKRVDEILVFDDASSVRPEPFVPPALPVRFIRSETNVGPARGRNVLLDHASSALIHFHDADDAFEPSWCDTVTALFSADPALDVAFTNVLFIAPDGVAQPTSLPLADIANGDDLVRTCMRGAMLVPAGTYRRELVRSIGGYRDGLWQSEDWDFHIRLACRSPRFAVDGRPLVIVHSRCDSRSRIAHEVWLSALSAVEHLETEIPGRYAGELSEAAARVGSVLYRLGLRDDARRAFALARRRGRPQFVHEGRAYRAIARYAGQEAAERCGVLYRGLLPTHWREAIDTVDGQRL